MQSKMQRLHLSFKRKLRKLKFKLMEQLFFTVIILLISIAIIFTSPMLGGLIILAFLVLTIIPILINEIKEIIKNIDK